MQISSNTTGMEAGLCVTPDKHGHDFCVVIVKGTYSVGADGNPALADEQEPLVYADVHYGDPATTGIRYECDFARFKPMADVLVNGSAHAPGGRPVQQLNVSLEFGRISKVIHVQGDRQWLDGIFGPKSPPPARFTEMPLIFDRAFGGSDHSHKKEKHHGTELRNPIGVGFHLNSDPKSRVGRRFPNLEDPRKPYKNWSDRPEPKGMGVVGRGWQPRIGFAGTYNDRWLEERYPFLPDDFDDRYFQSAPEDQQAPYPTGGEVVRCVNMAPREHFVARLPQVRIPMAFKFWNRTSEPRPNLDTIVIEPDRERIILTWRACEPIGRKLHALREIVVGRPPRASSGKRRFRGLREFIDWKKQRGSQ